MTKFSEVLAAASTAVLLIGVASCAEDEPSPSTNETSASDADSGPIRVGVILEITGEGASIGNPMQEAIELAVEEVNDAGGVQGRELELVLEDNQSSEDVSAQLTTEMITQDEVDIILGASRSGDSLAMAPIAESSQIPMISLSANSQVVADKEWVFKTVQNDIVVLQNMINYADEQGWETLGLLRDASGFGEGVDDLLSDMGAEKGITVETVEKFEPTATDFTAQMVNLRSTEADANVIWGIPPAVALAQEAYERLDVDAPVLHSHGIGNDVFLETAGDTAEGVIAPLGRLLVADQIPEDDPQREVIDSFTSKYQEAYGTAPSTFAGNAYDAMHVAVEAFENVGTDPQAVRDYIETMDGFAGITGIFAFSPDNHSGLDVNAPAFVTVEDGEWTLVDNNR